MPDKKIPVSVNPRFWTGSEISVMFNIGCIGCHVTLSLDVVIAAFSKVNITKTFPCNIWRFFHL